MSPKEGSPCDGDDYPHHDQDVNRPVALARASTPSGRCDHRAGRPARSLMRPVAHQHRLDGAITEQTAPIAASCDGSRTSTV